jgi:hypothetical protein
MLRVLSGVQQPVQSRTGRIDTERTVAIFHLQPVDRSRRRDRCE